MTTDKFDQYIRSVELIREKIPSFSNYPFSLSGIEKLETLEFHPNVTFLIGENGCGKSTLLEAVAVNYGFNPEGGSKNFNFSTQKTHSPLHDHIRIAKGLRKPQNSFFLRAESYYNVATEIEKLDEGGGGARVIDSYGGKSLHEQSHGESFFALFNHRFSGNGIYILDEPESALSPKNLLAFLVRLNDLVNEGAQFIIATHSPIIISYPHSKLIELNDGGYKETTFEQTEHYAIYKSLLNNPEGTLSKLF